MPDYSLEEALKPTYRFGLMPPPFKIESKTIGGRMKAILISAAISITILAPSLAMASIGDQVTYEGIQNGEAYVMNSTVTAKGPIDQVSGQQQWIVHTILNFQGKVKVYDETSTVISREFSKGLLDDCTQIGTNDTITVKAGTFKTCKLSQPNSPTAWIGDVPFGLVKEINIEQGISTTGEVSAYKWGTP